MHEAGHRLAADCSVDRQHAMEDDAKEHRRDHANREGRIDPEWNLPGETTRERHRMGRSEIERKLRARVPCADQKHTPGA